MNEETAKAVQEVAKTADSAINATRETGKFLARYLGGPLEEASGIAHDWLKMTRWTRQVRLQQRADEFLRASGLSSPSRAVSFKIAAPILQHATLEDDNALQDRWAALLANAANAGSGVDVTPAFVNILSQINSLEVQILETIYALPYDESRNAGVSTEALPHSATVVTKESTSDHSLSDPVMLAIGNLVRLGCLRMPGTWGGGEAFGSVNPTTVGRELVRACKLPNM